MFLRMLNVCKYLSISPAEALDIDHDFMVRLELYIEAEREKAEREKAREKAKRKLGRT